jgi:hypothetical protein
MTLKGFQQQAKSQSTQFLHCNHARRGYLTIGASYCTRLRPAREKIARHGFYVIFISSGVAMALDLNSGLNLHQPAAGEKPTA